MSNGFGVTHRAGPGGNPSWRNVPLSWSAPRTPATLSGAVFGCAGNEVGGTVAELAMGGLGPSRNGYPGRGPAARPGSRARLLEGTVTSPARPDPAHSPSGYDHVRPSPARSGACDPAQFSAGTQVLHIGTLPSRGTWSAQGRSGPPAAQRAHPAGSRT